MSLFKMNFLILFLIILPINGCVITTPNNKNIYLEILKSPEYHINQVVNFSASIKEYEPNLNLLKLHTYNKNKEFHITTIKPPMLLKDIKGNNIQIGKNYNFNNQKYHFQCTVENLQYINKKWIINATLTYKTDYPQIIDKTKIKNQ